MQCFFLGFTRLSFNNPYPRTFYPLYNHSWFSSLQCKNALQRKDKTKTVTASVLAMNLFKSPEAEWPLFGWVHQLLGSSSQIRGPARRQLLEEALRRNDRTE